MWVTGEYLLWWMKDGPSPIPLVTTGTPGRVDSGALGAPGTRVLFGGDGVDFGTISGMRFSMGGWIDENQRLGVEASGFLLEHATDSFSASSNAAGNPPLYLPAFNAQVRAERALVVSDPVAQFRGAVDIRAQSRLWGAESNALLNVVCQDGVALDLIAGFRYLDLSESFTLQNSTRDLILGVVDQLRDRFDTRNQFYGGQVGARLSFANDGPLWAKVTGKVALGTNHEVSNVAGTITRSGALAPNPGTFQGGFYTQPTNVGRRTNDQLGVVPEVEVKLGYDLFRGVSAFVGYNFLYWNQVVRPGDQIDRNLNQSQSPIFGNGQLVGNTRPQSQFNHNDFWVHGVNFGLAIEF